MSIAGVTEDEFREVLAEYLTPSLAVRTPERLFGREKNLLAISRALSSPGRQIFIYGDRGVGKTSLAYTAAVANAHASGDPIYVVCSKTSTFSDIIHAVGNATVDVKKRMERAASGQSLALSIPNVAGATYGFGTPGSTAVPAPQTINEALDVIRYVAAKRTGRTIIVIDEMERIEQPAEREKFAEFIKNIPELEVDVRFIFGGIATDVSELLESHPSAGRILEAIQLERLRHSDLWRIIEVVSDRLSITPTRETLIRISQISDGFPHFVHLIGESMFWHMFDAEEVLSETRPEDLKAGVTGALHRTEAALRVQYDKATMKTKHTEDYEEALWALADRNSDRRQLTEIFDSSYRRIMGERVGRAALSRESLNKRLLSLKQSGHGHILRGYGSGWFGFRENIMRGYVRLRAQTNGIELGRDA